MFDLSPDPFLGTDPRRALWRCASIDAPWPEQGGGGRGAQNHYPVADVKQIRNAILGSGKWLPYPDSHAWFWYTDNYLLDALWLVKELGFTYKRQFHWVKVKGLPMALDFDTGLAVKPPNPDMLEPDCGIGQYGRGAHESMLFCTRGRGMHPSVYNTARLDVPSTFFAPVPLRPGTKRKHHSRKPDASYELIEARSLGPRFEFFSRRGLPGWGAWGNEAPEQEEVDDV